MPVRAAVLEAPGSPVVVRDLDLIEPRAREVRVRMLASGVCHSDLHVRDGHWARPAPIVLGHEGAGIVEAVGPDVATPRVGDLVALSWLVPCGTCRTCRRGQAWACPDSPSYRHALLDGTLAFGDVRSYCAIATMAEASVVPAAAAIPVPAATDPAAAALIGCCVTTGVGAAMRSGAITPGSTVAVLGLGGVGLSAVMGAALAGAARIVAVDRLPSKLEVAREVGATDGLLATDDVATLTALVDLTDGGPDVVIEAIGRPETVALAVDALAVGGTAVLVGLSPQGERAGVDVYRLVDGGRRVIGCNYGFADPAVDFPRYAAWTLEGRLPVERLIDRRIGLDDLEDAFDALRAGGPVRQVVTFGGSG